MYNHSDSAKYITPSKSEEFTFTTLIVIHVLSLIVQMSRLTKTFQESVASLNVLGPLGRFVWLSQHSLSQLKCPDDL